MTLLYTTEQLAQATVKEINERINQAFVYDEYAWQKEQGIRIAYRKRAKGLHKVLYQCPNCQTEYRMTSYDDKLMCTNCSKTWRMTEWGNLEALGALPTEFSHIPDWYEWQRSVVRQEIEKGTYYFSSTVTVDALPNASGYIRLGEAHLVHDTSGFVLEGVFDQRPFSLVKPVESMYSCHIEYNYKGKGDCIDLSTHSDTFYLYPHGSEFSVTKIALATEELFYRNRLRD